MTRRITPAKMVECQTDLVRRLWADEKFQRLVSYVLLRQIGDSSWRTEDQNVEQATLAFSLLAIAARTAECYHVSEDMTQLVIHAASLLDDDDVFDSRLAPSITGLVRFEGGIPQTDVRGNVLNVDWLIWKPSATKYAPLGQDASGPAAPGTMFFEFNDTIDNPDAVTNDLVARMGYRGVHAIHGRWGFHGINYATDGLTVGPPTIDVEKEFPDWAARLKADGVTVPVPATNTKRVVHALWLLMGQEVTVTSKARPAHPGVTKAAKKEKITPSVTVVELRRRRQPSGAQPASGRAVEWSHRWYVNGFWRWQPYGPKRAQRRRIWVDGFVKGPDDKPLVAKPRVYDLRR